MEEEFGKEVSFIINDEEKGNIEKPSTIIDLSCGYCKVIRQGSVNIS